MVSLNEFDIKILQTLKKLKEESEFTPYQIMKMIYPEGRNREEEKIKYRMERMEKMGLFIIMKNSPKAYILIPENIFFKQIRCPRRENQSDSVWAYINNKWEIKEI